jgi:hypothetical protein
VFGDWNASGLPALVRVGLTRMRWYALIEVGNPEAIDVFPRPDDAERALEDCLRDEPEWRGLLRVEEIEFSATSEWAN